MPGCLAPPLLAHLRGGGEEVGVVAALLEVHHDVEEGDRLRAALVQLVEVLGQDPAVVLPVWAGRGEGPGGRRGAHERLYRMASF